MGRFTYGQIKEGVSQGSVLGPLIFSLFLNNLPWDLSSLDICLYADDIVILRGDNSVSNLHSQLQADFTYIWHWLHVNKLIVDTQKCAFMLSGTQQLLKHIGPIAPILDPLGNGMPQVSEQRYLFSLVLSQPCATAV